MPKPSPTQRTLKKLRDEGYTAQVVEHWNPFARRRVDLFGCIDIIAVKRGELLGVQCTSGTNTSARVKKAKSLPEIQAWIDAGGRFQVWGWRKLKAVGWVPAIRTLDKVDD